MEWLYSDKQEYLLGCRAFSFDDMELICVDSIFLPQKFKHPVNSIGPNLILTTKMFIPMCSFPKATCLLETKKLSFKPKKKLPKDDGPGENCQYDLRTVKILTVFRLLCNICHLTLRLCRTIWYAG